jgi:hypothetical protein
MLFSEEEEEENCRKNSIFLGKRKTSILVLLLFSLSLFLVEFINSFYAIIVYLMDYNAEKERE